MSSCLATLPINDARQSPFTRLIAFRVYDGPVMGLAQCEASDESFMFRLLSWDAQQVYRIYSLSPIDRGIVEMALAVLSSVETPRWPEWWLGAAPDRVSRDLVDGVVQSLVARAKEPVAVVMAEDLGKLLLRAVLLDADNLPQFTRLSRFDSSEAEVSEGSFHEWLIFLGVSR